MAVRPTAQRPRDHRPDTPRRRSISDPASLGFHFTKIGVNRFDISDPYHLALTIGWPAFVVTILGAFLALSSLFAGFYLLEPASIANAQPWSDRLFFSIETLATVGYGEMYPATAYGHIVASAEIMCGMGFMAITTGLIFVRFSRAQARFIFAEVAVITRHNGRPTLMVRLGNGRNTLLTKIAVQVNALINEESPEGGNYRRVHELKLVRAAMPIFPLITTFMHVIDAQSPLAPLLPEVLPDSDLRLIVSVEAYDPALGAYVQDLKTYGAKDIRLGARFVDTLTVHDDGRVVADLTRVSQIESSSDGQETWWHGMMED